MSNQRDKFHRCKICFKLFPNDACPIEYDKEGQSAKGMQCPNGCMEVFEQPPYELPIQE